MINKKLLALLAFTIYKSDCRTPQRIHRNEQKNKDNTMLYVIGGVSAVAIVGGAIWWFTKKDKTTEGQQLTAEREFNEQDINNMFKLNTKEEWVKLCEDKIKSHSNTIKKITEELEKFPDHSSEKEKEQKGDEILNNNKFAKDIIVAIQVFIRFGFSYALAKEFLNKYKNNGQIKNKEQLVQVFDGLLKLWPLKVKNSSVYNIYHMYMLNYGLKNILCQFKKGELYNKLEATVKQEENQLRDDEEALNKISVAIPINNIEQITNLTHEDLVALGFINDEMNSSAAQDVTRLFEDLFGNLPDLPVFYKSSWKTILQETIENSSLMQELQKCVELIENKLGIDILS